MSTSLRSPEPTFAPTLSAEPEAGPSRPTSLHATVSRDSQADQDLIEEALAHKRRKSSIIPGVHLHHFGTTRRKRADTHESEREHRQHSLNPHDSPERIAARKGPPVEDVGDDLDTEEGRTQQEELDRLIADAEEARAKGQTNNKDIQFLRDREPWPDFRPDQESFPPREYVWDVLFENQRGLYVFGKAYFSSMSLLPFDPSPYTLPSKPLPAASSNFLVSHPEGQSQIPSSQDKSAAPKGRNSIKTAYTPETFQLPTPAWQWLTPWMINMRTGTDEMGWRYNGVFKRKGWSSKAGPGGWGGWVRRREWVRLRCIKPQAQAKGDGGEAGGSSEEGNNETSSGKRKSLRGLLRGNGEQENDMADAVRAMVQQIDRVSLDREKLEIWQRWLDDLQNDGYTQQRLEAVLQDSASFHTLNRQFTYKSTRAQLRSLLVQHDLRFASSPSSSTEHTAAPTTPSGYEI